MKWSLIRKKNVLLLDIYYVFIKRSFQLQSKDELKKIDASAFFFSSDSSTLYVGAKIKAPPTT